MPQPAQLQIARTSVRSSRSPPSPQTQAVVPMGSNLDLVLTKLATKQLLSVTSSLRRRSELKKAHLNLVKLKHVL